ncbi:MAG: hypothetical protein VX834_10695 [Myxococcota bacterium]|nr:hypothetical protein [Myxococcota bacterium]
MVNVDAAMLPSKQIYAILPDDEDLIHRVIHALKDEKQILTAHQITCRGMGAVGRAARSPRFRSRPPKSLRLLTVVVPEDRADEVFDFVHDKANVNRPMGGIVFMGPLEGATAFLIPEGVEDEI